MNKLQKDFWEKRKKEEGASSGNNWRTNFYRQFPPPFSNEEMKTLKRMEANDKN